MKLSISHLAFPLEKDFNNSIEILKKNSINNIEIIIPKIISWDNLDKKLFKKFITQLNLLGFECLSTQSITYGTHLKSFCDTNFIDHIFKVSDLCQLGGIKVLVLGSPQLRDKFNEDILINNFKLIDSYLKNNNQILCIEPNSSVYNGNYFFILDEIINFIKKGDFTNIKTMIDTHNLINENLNPANEFLKYKDYIYHVHVSEIGLGIFKNSKYHKQLSTCLKNEDYKGIITYETKIAKKINDFKKIYA